MKKIFMIGMMVLVSVFMSVPVPTQAKEKTLGELRAEAKANRDAYNEAKAQKELTEQERNEATKQKKEVEAQITEVLFKYPRVQTVI